MTIFLVQLIIFDELVDTPTLSGHYILLIPTDLWLINHGYKLA